MLDFDTVWRAALDDLDVDVTLAEQMLALDRLAEQPARMWTPPKGLGPMPLALVERARSLHARQLDVARRLAESMALSRRQLDAVRHIRQRPESVPVYLDLPA